MAATPLPPHPLPRLSDGPEQAPATVLFAHGAGAPMDSPFMNVIAAGLGGQGWHVVRFEFAYMARMRETGRRHGPDRLPRLQEAFREQVRLERVRHPQRPLILAGKSMGGRVASLLVDELAATAGVGACVCFGYPFHPPGKPQQLRTAHLVGLRTPTLIVQGEKDPFGKREEVEAYALSSQVQVHWIPSGDHSLKPARRSGLSEADALAMALTCCDQTLRQQLGL